MLPELLLLLVEADFSEPLLPPWLRLTEGEEGRLEPELRSTDAEDRLDPELRSTDAEGRLDPELRTPDELSVRRPFVVLFRSTEEEAAERLLTLLSVLADLVYDLEDTAEADRPEDLSFTVASDLLSLP